MSSHGLSYVPAETKGEGERRRERERRGKKEGWRERERFLMSLLLPARIPIFIIIRSTSVISIKALSTNAVTFWLGIQHYELCGGHNSVHNRVRKPLMQDHM